MSTFIGGLLTGFIITIAAIVALVICAANVNESREQRVREERERNIKQFAEWWNKMSEADLQGGDDDDR